MTSPWPAPFRLQGDHCSLEPLEPAHHDDLVAAVRDGELWTLWYTAIPSPETMHAEIARRLELQAQGSMRPLTARNREGRIVGMTTLMHIDATHRRVEIGSTWTAASMHRTPFNTECKLLLLGHAFEQLNCIAVEFRTHVLNLQSRRAIERLGARLDGILRNHQRSPNGSLRDTCVYSILPAEWPAVQAHLRWQLARPR
ncbi:MAG: GNAT family N-acetyltransferase [Pseudomonadota bacterium]|nr:GNAT family N-acetyltransferase [Pseudomonadota bacterium]